MELSAKDFLMQFKVGELKFIDDLMLKLNNTKTLNEVAIVMEKYHEYKHEKFLESNKPLSYPSNFKWFKVNATTLPVRGKRFNWVSQNVLIISANYGFGFGHYDYDAKEWTVYPVGMNEEPDNNVLFFAYVPYEEMISMVSSLPGCAYFTETINRLIEQL
jgi:hypothetical protein